MFFKIIKKIIWLGLILLLISVGIWLYLNKASKVSEGIETAVITRGPVTSIANVSGKVEAKDQATLKFPTSGVIREVFKKEGDSVQAGEILASLVQDSLIAEYNASLSTLKYEEARKQTLLRGPNATARSVTETNVYIAEENLRRTELEQNRLVQNTKEILNSSELIAKPVNKTTDDVPPVVSGTYECEKEGAYTISVFGSKSSSGYSYRLTGLDADDIYPAYTDTSAPLGNCGLMIQFDEDEVYRDAEWTITIPNKESSAYLTNLNAFKLAEQKSDNAIKAASDALLLAQKTSANENASAGKEELSQANAQIETARAKLAISESRIADYVIKAPFDSIISEHSITVGEIADNTQYITIIQEGNYELKARIPEVDIRKITLGDQANITFDASPQEPVLGKIIFISPTSIQIEGVSYYEAIVQITNQPTWIREGLNADIDIIVEKKEQALLIPSRFTIRENDKFFTYTKRDSKQTKTPLEIGLVGNDGYIEVTNLPEGTLVFIP